MTLGVFKFVLMAIWIFFCFTTTIFADAPTKVIVALIGMGVIWLYDKFAGEKYKQQFYSIGVDWAQKKGDDKARRLLVFSIEKDPVNKGLICFSRLMSLKDILDEHNAKSLAEALQHYVPHEPTFVYLDSYEKIHARARELLEKNDEGDFSDATTNVEIITVPIHRDIEINLTEVLKNAKNSVGTAGT